jgi:hypothetical protein
MPRFTIPRLAHCMGGAMPRFLIPRTAHCANGADSLRRTPVAH